MNMQSSKSLLWIGVVCFVLLAAIEIERVTRRGIGEGTLSGLLLAVVLVGCMFVYFDVRDYLRLKAVRTAHPGVFVSHVVIYPELVSQLNKLAEIMGGSPVEIRPGRHGTIAVDAVEFGIFGGYAKPKELFVASGLQLIDARIAGMQQGLWKRPCLELAFEVGQKDVVVDLSLLRIRFGVPRVLSKRALEKLLPDITRFVIEQKR